MAFNRSWDTVAETWEAVSTTWDFASDSRGDTASVGVVESSSLLAFFTKTDSVSVSATEVSSSAISTTKTANDSVSLSLSESSSASVSIERPDILSISLSDLIEGITVLTGSADSISFGLLQSTEILIEDWPQSGPPPAASWGKTSSIDPVWTKVPEAPSTPWV